MIPDSYFGQRYTSLRDGLFRNLVAICFLVSMAPASRIVGVDPNCYYKKLQDYNMNWNAGTHTCGVSDGGYCLVREFTLTTKKSGLRTKIAEAAALGMLKDTSTIEVRYYPTRDYHNWAGYMHKHEKINSWCKPNEWFSIIKLLEHDKENNRVNVEMQGIQDRWIYYLEQDGLEFFDVAMGISDPSSTY